VRENIFTPRSVSEGGFIPPECGKIVENDFSYKIKKGG